MLKRFKEDNLGHVDNGSVCVNIELLWAMTKDESKFIREFSSTYTHELLHILMANVLGKELKDIAIAAEEELIRALLGEEWDNELEAMYAEDALA